MAREVNISWTPTTKQKLVWDVLEDKETNEVLAGGSAGFGKSFVGCAWLIINCLRYPGTRWLMSRAVLKDLKASTLLTFFEICSMWGLQKDLDYKYNQIDGIVTFIQTGSTIYLKELSLMPSDPEFSGLGSREYTGIFIDEGDAISVKGYNIAKSRIRYKLDNFCECGGDLIESEVISKDETGKPTKWKCKKCGTATQGLIPKILIATNPCKNFLYYDFYQPYKKGTLPKYKKFVPALPGDNPYLSKHYIANLNKLDNLSKERLLLGNWEYDETDDRLFEYEDILRLFTNNVLIPTQREKYMSIDLARKGKDKSVVFVWDDLIVEKIIVLPKYEKNPLKETRLELLRIAQKYKIPICNIIADEDGLGGGIVDEMDIYGFVNNSRALELKREQNPMGIYTEAPKHNYANLKAQCYFLLAKYVKERRIGIYQAINEEVKGLLIEDLEQIRELDPDNEKKLQVVSKDKIKEVLGRSPDFSDALMFRMWFELKPYITSYIR